MDTNETKPTRAPERKLTLARTVAPEDLRRGAYVAVLYRVLELVPCEPEPWKDPAPRRIRVLPGIDAGTPLRIREVCLPYVLVERPGGEHRTIDIRRFTLALLSERYAERAFKHLAAATPSILEHI